MTTSRLIRPLGLLSLMLFALGSLAQKQINPGDPKTGTTTYTITFPTGPAVVVSVVIDTAEVKTSADKAAEIVKQMNAQKPTLNASETSNGNVTIPLATDITSAGKTGEKDKFAANNGPGGSFYALSGTLTGTASGGGPAEYSVAFGFDGTTIGADVFYSSLTTPTIDDLMTVTYDDLLAELPADRDSELSLDLSTDTIRFNFLPSDVDVSIESFSSDPGITVTQSLATTPEPSTLLLLGPGLIGIFARKYRRSQGGRGRRFV